ncbi:MAG TPA: hypothetical protein VF458_17735 [Ktedonobacteraceae bacterium]
MKVLLLLKGKLLLTVASAVLIAGGATVAFAATPAGQSVVQSITHGKPSVTPGATHAPDHDPSVTPGGKKGSNACPGLADAQNLATSYHLSTSAQGDAVKTFCALHQGTFKGTTTSGSAVTTSRVYGYGEVNQLLTYAQYMAAHDSANAGGKLTDANVSGFLANALHSCGTTPLAACLKAKIPGYQPGKGGDNNGNGKPTTTPTPGRKPTATPTPHA